MNIQYHTSNSKLWLAMFTLLFISACQDNSPEPIKPLILQTVEAHELKKMSFYEHKQQFSGSIRAANTTGVGFELAGKIEYLLVDSGDSVKEGQALASLNSSLLLAQQQELSASLAQNHADLQLAKNTLNRSLELTKKGYVSEQTLDEVKGKLNSLLAGKKRLQASLKSIELQLEKSTLLAPFTGNISARHQNLGEVVSMASPIFTLIESNSPHAYIGIPVNIARQFTQGQSVTVRVNDQAYPSIISGISGQLNPVTRTQEIRVAMPISAPVINGELAYLDFFQQVNKPGYWVPISALTEGIRGLWNVYIISDATNKSETTKADEYVIERRDVEIIYTDKGRAFIQGAVNDGEKFVAQGLHKLVVGQRVSINRQHAAR